ncbi:MAG: DNA polymerase III subunit beta [Phycisphaerales bacterium]|jgi:DNA polymerase-3 subunit beta|nr:DNA polymerase III subunit beta [Phycisphaerales bacterium]
MKVICNRGALLEALNVVGNVITPRTPKPVLLCIKLTAADDKLTLAATDLEVAIRYSDNQVQIDQGGEVLLPADKLRDIVRESIDDTLAIEVEGESATIKGQDSHFKIFTQPAGDFPLVPDFEGEADFSVPGGQLKRLISHTLFAAARESTRYAFNGVLLNIKGSKLNLVSTDGRRLAQARGDVSRTGKSDKASSSAIIPAKAMQLIDKLIDDVDEPVAFQVRENQVIVHTANATLTTNLVEGQFPPYEDVIPKDTDKKMTGNTADFLSAVRRASLLTTEESKGVRMQFGKHGLVLSSRSPEAGEATVNYPCKFEGADVEIGFNPAFLIEALKVVDTDEFSLELTASTRPGLLRGGPDFLYVIMPVNLQ